MGGNNLADHLKKNRQPSSTNDLMQEFLMCHDYLSGEGGMKLPERRKYRQTILQTLEELKIAFAVNSSGTVALVRQFRLVESKLRPMNLRYSADFRRSHLIEPQPLTDKSLYFNRLFQICLSNCSKQFHHTCNKLLENGLPLRGKELWTCRKKTRNEVDSTLYTSFCWLGKSCNEILWNLVQKSQNCSCN